MTETERCARCGRSPAEHPVHLHGTGIGDCAGHRRPEFFLGSSLPVRQFDCSSPVAEAEE